MEWGQKLEVVLRASQGMQSWSHPVSSDQSVLAPIVDPAATAAQGVTLAAFEAKRTGEATVTSYPRAACPSGQPRPLHLAVYSLRLTITPYRVTPPNAAPEPRSAGRPRDPAH